MFNHYYCQVSLSSFLIVFPLQTWKTVGQQPLYNHLSNTQRQLSRCPSALFFQVYTIYLPSILNISVFLSSLSLFDLIKHFDYFSLNSFHFFYITEFSFIVSSVIVM